MFILSIFDEFEEMFAHRSYNTTLWQMKYSSLLLYLVVELLCEPRISFICGRRRIAIICNYIPWEYVFTFWSYNGKDLKIFRGMDDLQKYVSLIYSLSLLTIANLYTLQAGFEP